MRRRSFVRLLTAAAFVRDGQLKSDAPPLRVVSKYKASSTPGMPGPYPGRVVSVRSDRSVDPSTGAANDEVVREMLARGMRELTGARTTPDAWRRFFEPSDIVGIKVNCGGYPHCVSAYEIVADVVRQAISLRERTSLSGREDWARHFCLSAALTVLETSGRTKRTSGIGACMCLAKRA